MFVWVNRYWCSVTRRGGGREKGGCDEYGRVGGGRGKRGTRGVVCVCVWMYLRIPMITCTFSMMYIDIFGDCYIV